MLGFTLYAFSLDMQIEGGKGLDIPEGIDWYSSVQAASRLITSCRSLPGQKCLVDSHCCVMCYCSFCLPPQLSHSVDLSIPSIAPSFLAVDWLSPTCHLAPHRPYPHRSSTGFRPVACSQTNSRRRKTVDAASSGGPSLAIMSCLLVCMYLSTLRHTPTHQPT